MSIRHPAAGHARLMLSLTAAAALAACGGSGGDPEPVEPLAVHISGKAVDGPLQGALACYDLNDDGTCSAGEPVSAPTDAQGRFTLEVDAADAGAHRVIVQVPADAVDADTGAAVGAAFVLQAPPGASGADHAVFASPLSTLVLREADRRGSSLAEAEALVQGQADLAMSPLADYSLADDPAHRHAASVARAVLVGDAAQRAALGALVGQVDFSGQAVDQAAVDALAHDLTMAALPRVAAAVADPTVADASASARRSAIDAAATRIAQAMTPADDEALVATGAARLPAAEPDPVGVASLSLPALRYTDADNWFMRSFQSSAAEATPAADGSTVFRSVYRQRVAGAEQTWDHGRAPERAGDMHWNGSAWLDCQAAATNRLWPTATPGQSRYDYCGGLELGVSTKSVVDLSGLAMADVLRERIRSFPGSYAGVPYAEWGPADLAVLGNASFPAGSRLQLSTTTMTASAMGYNVLESARVKVASAAVAAGGDARGGGTPACSGSDPGAPATTLEQIVERFTGRPCVFDPGSNSDGVSGPRNESWGWTTLGMGSLAGAAEPPDGTGAYYSDELRIRISFDGAGSTGVTFHQCLVRRQGGSTRQCDAIGRGAYTVQAVGDARVLRVAPLPERVRELGHEQVFVERGGFVHYGWIAALAVAKTSPRLNLEAANALLTTLGLAPITP